MSCVASHQDLINVQIKLQLKAKNDFVSVIEVTRADINRSKMSRCQFGMNPNVDAKVVVLGCEFSGKTSLVQRFLYDRFIGDNKYQVQF